MEIFLELGYFDKHSSASQERRVLQEKNFGFFLLEKL